MIKFLFAVCLFVCRVFPDDIAEAEKLEFSIISNFCKKQKIIEMKLMGIGGSEEKGKTKKVQVAFDCKKELGLKEARDVLIRISSELLNDLNSVDEYKKYQSNTPFDLSNVCVELFLLEPSSAQSESISYAVLEGGILDFYKRIRGRLVNVVTEKNIQL